MSSENILTEIKAIRRSKRLTQAEVAKMAGIPLRTYQRLESGDRGSKLETLLRTLDALSLTLRPASKRRPALGELDELYGNE